MKNEPVESARKPAQSAALIVWVALGLGLLTFCGGKTDDSQSSGGAGGNAGGGASGQAGFSGDGYSGDGYAGHTSGCPTQCGCPGWGECGGNAGQGGFGGNGLGGHSSGCLGFSCGGNAGQGGFSGQTGFGGHTSGCVGMCGNGCPPCPVEAGTDAHLVSDAFAEARSAEAASMIMAAANVVAPQSCYVLSGYEPDPCLPIDDSLLPWLSNVPTSCQPHVTAGPFLSADNQQGRTCCYSVACE